MTNKYGQYYEPGLKFQITTDAVLYGNAFQIPAPIAQSYIDQLRGLVNQHGATNTIMIHDYAALLKPYERKYLDRYNQYYQKLGETPEELLDPETLARIRKSVHSCLNTRQLGIGYMDHLALFGPNRDPNNPYYTLLEHMASVGLRDLIATKMAAQEMNLYEEMWPGYLRASCHKGRKDDHAVIGMRTYPSYYRISKLLPYQGMPLLTQNENGVAKLIIEPEIVLRGRPDLVRITKEADEVYVYVSTELMKIGKTRR